MNKQSICRCVVASLLSITAASWAQTSVGLGRADYKDNCASCHGVSGKGDGPMHSFLVKPPSEARAMTEPGDSPRTAEWSARQRIASLLKYLETIQQP